MEKQLFTFITLILFFKQTAWGPQPNIKAGQKTSTVAEKGQFEEPPHRRDTSTPQRRPSSSASSSPRSPTAGPSSLHTPPSKTQTRESGPLAFRRSTAASCFTVVAYLCEPETCCRFSTYYKLNVAVRNAKFRTSPKSWASYCKLKKSDSFLSPPTGTTDELDDISGLSTL